VKKRESVVVGCYGGGGSFYCNPGAVIEGYYTSFRFLRDVISGDLTRERERGRTALNPERVGFLLQKGCVSHPE
jgi:hypothetical protein